MIVDAHLHVWRSDPDFPDQTATTVSPAVDVPLAVLDSYMVEHQVDRAVIVQPVYPGEDNSYVADCAKSEPDRFAAVCVVDPRQKDAPDKLAYWVNERGCRGLRLRPKVPAEEACFGDESTFVLWERIRELNVVVSLLCGFEHLPTVAGLAARFPEVPIIVDHMAHPPMADATQTCAFEPLLSLALHEHIYIKTSGFPYFSQAPYPYADCTELFRMVYDRFGPQRMIWGSDFPHILLQSGYARARHLLERAHGYLHPDELATIMGANASRLYWDGDDD